MNYKTVGTHDGSFHLDELIAIAALRMLNPDLGIVRTRNEVVLETLDARVDIGMKYDPASNTFDHHFKEGAGKRQNGVPYASAGLIWKHFGRELCISEEAHSIVDKKLIQFVDSIDNSMKQYGSNVYTLFELVKGFNTRAEFGRATQEQAFYDSLAICQNVLENEVIAANEQARCNVVVREALTKSGDKEYVILDQDILWQPVVVEESDKKYVIYPSSGGQYRVRAVPTEVDGFESRLALPVSWAGLNQEALEKESEVVGAIFCHKGLFVASARTLDAAVALAEKAIAHYKKTKRYEF